MKWKKLAEGFAFGFGVGFGYAVFQIALFFAVTP